MIRKRSPRSAAWTPLVLGLLPDHDVTLGQLDRRQDDSQVVLPRLDLLDGLLQLGAISALR